MKKICKLLGFLLVACLAASSQPLHNKHAFTHQDTLRGSITPERAWWDVQRYDIRVRPDYAARSIEGQVTITYRVVAPCQGNACSLMQIDLQQPLEITRIEDGARTSRPFTREGNVFHVSMGKSRQNETGQLTIFYRGNPRIAVNPPWDGGWIFTRDAKGRPWMTVACQGLGASVWYPCKDHQSDEPDQGASLSIEAPDSLVAVGNGRLKEKQPAGPGYTRWTWEVKNPINNYDIIPYIGYYVNWTETYAGEKGPLDCSYWVLDYDLEKAKKQFTQVKDMLKCFEYWMGPYPFYEDSYKLVETPHLGMEHQSAVAYGNKFMDGYLGMDLSGTGWGKKWDYIIVHESGHEWFGNNLTTKDIADMWIHEGFTDYTETLFVECQYGKEAADAYTQGLRASIQNNSPVIGPYGVNQEGSGDMYNKGNNLLHMVRQLIGDDDVFRQILRGLNKDFYHQTVTSRQVEDYISRKSGKDLSRVFDQYLRTANIPVLEYRIDGQDLSYRWTHCIDGFDMPVRLSDHSWLKPTTDWQKVPVTENTRDGLSVDRNFYIQVKRLE
ncbi:MAG TPA: M1 family metallopeptidase [Chitinophagaceae bacterium]|nr:M1 family metallopeptidase [Chitinophagaceae bacterium]